MSHILDALRQAEDERKLGKPVTRSTIAGPLRPVRRRQPRRSKSALAIGLILGVVALLAWAAWSWSTRDSAERDGGKPPASAVVPHSDAGEMLTDLPLSSLPPETLPPPAAAAAGAVRTDAERGEALPRARIQDSERLQSLDTLYATPERSTPADAAAGSAPVIAPQDIFQPQATPARPSPPSREPRTALAGFDENAPLPTPGALGVDAIDVAVHVHNPDAASRFILVDGRRYNAGDTLPGGVRLESIEANAIVLHHRGQYMRQFLR